MLGMPLPHLQQLRLEEFGRRQAAGKFAPQRPVQGAASRQPAHLEHRRLDRDVGCRLRKALGDGPHAVADLQAEVPASADEPFKRRGRGVIGRGDGQDEQVDIGMGNS
jgi:hypothetical protein